MSHCDIDDCFLIDTKLNPFKNVKHTLTVLILVTALSATKLTSLRGSVRGYLTHIVPHPHVPCSAYS